VEALTAIGTAILGGSVLAALITLGITAHREGAKTEREFTAAKRAIQAELDSAAKHAHGYLKPDAIRAVGWRASTLVYESVFPKLLSLSVVTRDATDALINYYQNVESFNRSLDQIAEYKATDRENFASREAGRAILKAIPMTSSQNLRAVLALSECEPGVRAEIETKLLKYEGRTLYDVARHELSLLTD
jgi:hypothetical protein